VAPSTSEVSPVNIDSTVPPSTSQVVLDAQFASQLQAMHDEDDSLDPTAGTISSSNEVASSEVVKLDDACSVVKALSEKVDKSGQLFIVIRRGCPLSRLLGNWRRVVKRDH